VSQTDLFDRPPRWMPGIAELINDVATSAGQEHREVLAFIARASKPVTQADIADGCPAFGAHWREVSAIPELKHKAQSTLRKIRQLVRDLRVDHGVPIISGAKGYALPRSVDEVDTYVERKHRQAKANAASWFETYRAVERFTSKRGITLDLFSEVTHA